MQIEPPGHEEHEENGMKAQRINRVEPPSYQER
jgi:hypothetical protein